MCLSGAKATDAKARQLISQKIWRNKFLRIRNRNQNRHRHRVKKSDRFFVRSRVQGSSFMRVGPTLTISLCRLQVSRRTGEFPTNQALDRFLQHPGGGSEQQFGVEGTPNPFGVTIPRACLPLSSYHVDEQQDTRLMRRTRRTDEQTDRPSSRSHGIHHNDDKQASR